MNGYPINWPFSKLAGALGAKIKIKIEVCFDPDAQVYIATSPSLRGLVIEAHSLDEIRREIELVLPDFLDAKNNTNDPRTNHACLEFCTDLHAA